jgi:hypothetical protein
MFKNPLENKGVGVQPRATRAVINKQSATLAAAQKSSAPAKAKSVPGRVMPHVRRGTNNAPVYVAGHARKPTKG